MYKLPENIKDFRMMRQLTQKDLANKLNRAVGTIANWEKGTTSPPVEVLIDLSVALGTSPNELLGWSKSEELEKFKKDHEAILELIHKLYKQKSDIDNQLKLYSDYMLNFSKTNNESRPDFISSDLNTFIEVMPTNNHINPDKQDKNN